MKGAQSFHLPLRGGEERQRTSDPEEQRDDGSGGGSFGAVRTLTIPPPGSPACIRTRTSPTSPRWGRWEVVQ